MSTKEELLQKIKGVQTLAERGADGEREAAQAMLAHLMEKYGLSESDIESEQVEIAWFRYHDELERRILGQIIFMVTGKTACGCVGADSNRKRKKLGTECTAAERLEIEANYVFFYAAAKKELEAFLYAFYSKNRLFPSPDKVPVKEWPEMTEEEKMEAMKASFMMQGMERHTLRKSLGSGEMQ